MSSRTPTLRRAHTGASQGDRRTYAQCHGNSTLLTFVENNDEQACAKAALETEFEELCIPTVGSSTMTHICMSSFPVVGLMCGEDSGACSPAAISASNVRQKGRQLANAFLAKIIDGLNATGVELPRGLPTQWIVKCAHVGTGLPALE